MPKDTKSSGYNKAPACESRGFGHKKVGENFDTPSLDYLVCRSSCPVGHAVLTDNKLPQKQFIKVT